METFSSSVNNASRTARNPRSVDALIDRCEGAYSKATLKSYRTDLRAFAAWCTDQELDWLPARSETVAAYVDSLCPALTPGTLKRRLSAIGFAHRYSDLPCPLVASSVTLAIRRAERKKPSRPAQAHGMTREILARLIEGCGDDLLGLRDAALLSVGYDTLCRSAEICAMQVNHVRPGAGDVWSILIPRSKADQAGAGRIAWLSPDTTQRVSAWVEAAGIVEGALFRSVHQARPADTPLNVSSVQRLVKRAAKRAGVPYEVVKSLSGHSMRIGAAQDMMVAGFDSLAIMQAGGWKTQHVLLRYVENASTRVMHERRWKALAGAQT
jgi:integrase/recombinase XerD